MEEIEDENNFVCKHFQKVYDAMFHNYDFQESKLPEIEKSEL